MTGKRPPRLLQTILFLVPIAVLALGTAMILSRNMDRNIEPFVTVSDAEQADLLPELRKKERMVRQAVSAGRFYSSEPAELYGMINALLQQKKPLGLNSRAVLVPHAGYIFSGEVAAAAFREVGKDFNRVFLLAANHSGDTDFSGVSIPAVTHYAIPGAEIPIAEIADTLIADPLFVSEPKAHTQHMLEVELPFLHALKGQPANPGFVIIPMILGRMDENNIHHLADMLSTYADEQTLFVFSVDLSHFYPDGKARELDDFSVQAVMNMDEQAVKKAVTDGDHVLLTMLGLAKNKGWSPVYLQYKNSGDVSGDQTRVVGYAAIAFQKQADLSDAEQKTLLQLARRTLEKYYVEQKIPDPDHTIAQQYPNLAQPSGVFVTLKKDGRLRGCIGSIITQTPLYEGVQSCAIKSALMDSRFTPVTKDELSQLTISISVLTTPKQMQAASPSDYLQIIRPGKDGIIIVYKGRSSTFLPQVWHDLPDPEDFLAKLCLKQGAPAACWQEEGTTLSRYEALEFGEPER